MKYIYDGISITNGRPQNMDSLLITTRIVTGHYVLLALVCDGVGNLPYSDYASATTVKLLNDWFTTLTDVGDIGLKMYNSILDINRIIIEHAQSNGAKVATTISALLLVGKMYHIVNA